MVSLAAGWATLGPWNEAAFAASLLWLSAFTLRAPLSTMRQYRVADPPKALKALGFSLLLSVIFAGSVWVFWTQAPRAAQQLFLLAAAPLGFFVFTLALFRRSLRFLLAELLGFAFLCLSAPILYLTGPSAPIEAALFLYITLAGYFLISLFYVRVRLEWLRRFRDGLNRTLTQRFWDLRFVLMAGVLWTLSFFFFPTAEPWLALAPLYAIGRILTGILWGKANLPMMRLGLREMFHSIVFLFLVLTVWRF